MTGKDLVPLTPAAQPAISGLPVPQQQDRRSEAAIITISRWAKRNRHFTVPLAVPATLWLAALLLHHLHLAFYMVPLCGALLAGSVWFFAPHKWRNADGSPRWAEVWYARLSASLGALWLWLASLLGPLGGFVIPVVLASVLTAGCGAWGYFWWQHKRPRGMKKRQRLVAQCDAWWLTHCHHWNLHGSHVIDAELSGVTLRIRVRGLAGRHTLQHFRQAIPFIESAAEGQADIGMVRVEPVKGKPSEVDIFLKQDNPLRGKVDYDMDLAPRSVHELAPLVWLETEKWLMFSLRKNRFVNGESRSGKSNDLLVGLAYLSGCLDARPVVIDLKGGRSARPVLKACAAEYVVTSVDEARMYLRMQIAECLARQKYAYTGEEQLLATPEVPGWWTMVDETYGLTATENGAGDAECRRLMSILTSQGMGVEEYVWVYTQHGSLETSVGTEQIRANLKHRTCYRVAEARHGAYCIAEYNRLDASKLEEDGSCYVKDGPKSVPEQGRGPYMPHPLFLTVAGQNAALLGPRPPVYLYCGNEVAIKGPDGDVTWQQWWDDRWLRLDEAFRDDSPQYQEAAAAVGPQVARPAAAGPAPSPGVGDSHAVAARITGEDADLMARVPDDFRPDPELVRRLPQVIASQEERFCEALEAATSDSPATPRDLMAASGMGRSWVFDRLGALAEVGTVTQVSRSRYVLVPGSDIRRSLAEIKERNKRLNQEARDLIDAG